MLKRRLQEVGEALMQAEETIRKQQVEIKELREDLAIWKISEARLRAEFVRFS